MLEVLMMTFLFLFLQLLYVVYCTVMIVIVIHFVPNYTSTREFTGLQFPISTLVRQLEILFGNQQICALSLSQKSQLAEPVAFDVVIVFVISWPLVVKLKDVKLLLRA